MVRNPDKDKDIIISRLKQQGCRITKQRLMLLDVILEEDCSSCKEIYYKAVKKDPKIGAATVYRMVNTLEEIGAINRKNMYRITCDENDNGGYTVRLNDDSSINLSESKWSKIIESGLEACGYIRAKSCIMKTATTVQENCEDIYADAKTINETKYNTEEVVLDSVDEDEEA